MATPFYDGNYASPVRLGPARRFAPFPSNEFVLVEEDFRQTYAGWLAGTGAVAIGDLNGSLANYYLAKISDPRREGPTVVFTRTWAKKPTDFDTWETVSYNFIGYYGASGQTYIEGRERRTEVVPIRQAHKFYRIAASGGDYTSAGSIPLVAAQKYVWNGTTNDTDFLADSPPFSSASNPTRTAYEALVTAGTEIVVQDSRIRQWLGPFYERITGYTKAK